MCALLWSSLLLPAQTSSVPPAPATPATTDRSPGDPAPGKGQIVIQSHGEPPAGDISAPKNNSAEAPARVAGEKAKVDISDAERSAPTLTSYDLDAHLTLERAGLEMRARVTVRNDGATPLSEIPLQISSTLHWDSATLVVGDRRTPLALSQHWLDTDADHTGAATEAVLPLPVPLAPGASVSLDMFYSGTVAQNADRLARLGANGAQQRSADWDGISSAWTGLRGFGNVLWYPVAAPQLFLAEGNTLFTASGRLRLREENASIRLRLSVAYAGEPPAAAYFCGRRAALKAVADDPDASLATGRGLATATFSPEPLGFRQPSLFVLEQPETLLGGSEGGQPGTATAGSSASSSSSNPELPASHPPEALSSALPDPATPLIALVSVDPGTAAGLGAAADGSAALLSEWLGPRPLSALTILDHEGQPFQDGPLLVAPAATLQTSPEGPALVYSLTHAWVQTGQPWMDEGLGQFFALLWVEREHGREAALGQLTELLQPVTLAEPDLSPTTAIPAGQPLIAAADELFYRRKAAAVWWMLRDLVGEKPLHAALSAWRTQAESHDAPEAQAVAFEHLLERLSGKDLGWFFADWVLRDRGLPDLSIADVASSQTPATPGHNTGWLVAVTVRNEGAAAAEVPLIVRSGQFNTTGHVHIPGFSQVTQRVLVQAAPTEIIVNDGGTPEVRSSTHSRIL